jgi:prepilin-type N-terminal cleavage/methylation domain-containing protein
MKQKQQNRHNEIANKLKHPLQGQYGFTLVELMAVITIMVILASVMVINLAKQRASRDIKIAENQLVTDIREAQSETLSSRILPNGQQAQFYIIKVDSLNTPNQYTLQAIYNVSTSPQLVDIKTVNLPANIHFVPSTVPAPSILIDRTAALDQTATGPVSYTQPVSCALVAFSAPFAKTILNGQCAQANWDPNNDDYAKIINFQNNVPCSSVGVPPQCTASTDSIITFTLSDFGNTVTKQVKVNAITGSITFN